MEAARLVAFPPPPPLSVGPWVGLLWRWRQKEGVQRMEALFFLFFSPLEEEDS